MPTVPIRYIPRNLTKKDKKRQARELKKSRRAYKKQQYYTRGKIKSFATKSSPHIRKARQLYKVNSIKPSQELAKATKCKLKGLKKMFQKGQGAYFSSGSRPNQTAHSWGYARLASAITGGKASAVDYHIIESNCRKDSKALKLAKKTYKGRRRVPQTQIGGRRPHHRKGMREKIIKFKRGPYPKKYTAYIKNKKTKKTRKIHFGDRRYQQYKDRTPLKLYKHKNHGSRKRMRNYFNRHSGTKIRKRAIKREKRKSGKHYTAKILSHIYLW
jgi:glutaredoxin